MARAAPKGEWTFERLMKSAKTLVNPGGKRAKWRGASQNYSSSAARKHDRTIPFVGTKSVLFQFSHSGLTESNVIHRIHLQFFGLRVFREDQINTPALQAMVRGKGFFKVEHKGTFFVEKPSVVTPVRVRCTCFTGDTLIPLADGHSVPIKELVGREEFFVYSFDQEKKKVRIGRGHSCRKTGEDQMVLKVVLDNGQAIRCTPDHEFLMKDGSKKEAGELVAGDSLEPLYRKISEKGNSLVGYEQVYQPHQERWVYTHVLSDMWRATQGLLEKVAGKFVRHHVDFNRRNNHPSNLVRMNQKEHAKLHGRDAGRNFKAHIPEIRVKATRTLNRRIAAGEIDLRPNMRKANDRTREMVRLGIHHLQSDDHREKMRVKFIADNPMADKSKRKKAAESHRVLFLRRRKPLLDWLRELPLEGIRVTDEHAQQFGFKRKDVFLACVRSLKKATGVPIELLANSQARKLGTVIRPNGDLQANHKVVSVEFDGYEDVYCFTVDGYGNFAVDVDGGKDCSSGVFVSNCADSFFRWNWWNSEAKAIFGGKPRKYQRKTTTAPSVNPGHEAGVCKHMLNSLLAIESDGKIKPGTRSPKSLRV